MIINEEKRQQIMSYIIHAWEILEKENHFPKQSYKYIYLPQWPELYTAALKAAWYLFLDKTIKHATIIIQQNEYKKEIVWYESENKSDFLVWGNKIKNIVSKYTSKNLVITKELFDQILYLRLLTEIKTISIVWIGELVEKTKIATVIKNISKEDWVVVLWGLSKEENNGDKDQEMMQNVLWWTIYKKNPKWIGNIYKDIIKKNKKQAEVLVYLNWSDIGIKTLPQIWYVCMIA